MATLFSLPISGKANAIALVTAVAIGLYHYEFANRSPLVLRQSGVLHGNATHVFGSVRDLELFAFMFPGYSEVLPARIFDSAGGAPNTSAVQWRTGELFTAWWSLLPLTDLIELTSTMELERYDFGKLMIFQDKAPLLLLRYEFVFEDTATGKNDKYTKFELRLKTLRTSALFDLTVKQYYKWILWPQVRKRIFDLKYHFDPK